MKYTQDFNLALDGYYYSSTNPKIRFKIVEDRDPIFGGIYEDFRFEIFKRPFLWGLLGRKKWDMSVQTNGFYEGLSFSNFLLK
ncbi:hypothetical protein HZQ12_17785 [Elizabethkingia anophelis]|uniref:hypothetical protein n=1 Tax=Elizabethkingia anophelis TaxID=1117645 RepID=UPI0021A5DD03|nr:hypothetical protein [Elizabethkingia anophelis]MCT3978752.1 hypothetical protein [Elizabethkingia anophelis]MCT4042878.1 hypothetical protein [Elizabethkingia anophelis]